MRGPEVRVLQVLSEDASGDLHRALLRQALPRLVVRVGRAPHALVTKRAIRMLLLHVCRDFRDLHLSSTNFAVAGQKLADLKMCIESLALAWGLAVRTPDDRKLALLHVLLEVECRNHLLTPSRLKRAPDHRVLKLEFCLLVHRNRATKVDLVALAETVRVLAVSAHQAAALHLNHVLRELAAHRARRRLGPRDRLRDVPRRKDRPEPRDWRERLSDELVWVELLARDRALGRSVGVLIELRLEVHWRGNNLLLYGEISVNLKFPLQMLLAIVVLLLLFWRAAPRVAGAVGALFACALWASPELARASADFVAVLLDDLEARVRAPTLADFFFPAALIISGPEQQAALSLFILFLRTNEARVAGALESVRRGLRGAEAKEVTARVQAQKTRLQKKVAGLAEGALAELALFRDTHFGRPRENAKKIEKEKSEKYEKGKESDESDKNEEK